MSDFGPAAENSTMPSGASNTHHPAPKPAVATIPVDPVLVQNPLELDPADPRPVYATIRHMDGCSQCRGKSTKCDLGKPCNECLNDPDCPYCDYKCSGIRCVPCRQKKIQCNGQLPCHNCDNVYNEICFYATAEWFGARGHFEFTREPGVQIRFRAHTSVVSEPPEELVGLPGLTGAAQSTSTGKSSNHQEHPSLGLFGVGELQQPPEISTPRSGSYDEGSRESSMMSPQTPLEVMSSVNNLQNYQVNASGEHTVCDVDESKTLALSVYNQQSSPEDLMVPQLQSMSSFSQPQQPEGYYISQSGYNQQLLPGSSLMPLNTPVREAPSHQQLPQDAVRAQSLSQQENILGDSRMSQIICTPQETETIQNVQPSQKISTPPAVTPHATQEQHPASTSDPTAQRPSVYSVVYGRTFPPGVFSCLNCREARHHSCFHSLGKACRRCRLMDLTCFYSKYEIHRSDKCKACKKRTACDGRYPCNNCREPGLCEYSVRSRGVLVYCYDGRPTEGYEFKPPYDQIWDPERQEVRATNPTVGYITR